MEETILEDLGESDYKPPEEDGKLKLDNNEQACLFTTSNVLRHSPDTHPVPTLRNSSECRTPLSIIQDGGATRRDAAEDAHDNQVKVGDAGKQVVSRQGKLYRQSQPRKKVLQLHSQGKTVKEIAEKMNISQEGVKFHLKKEGFLKTRIHRRTTDEEIKKIEELYLGGWTSGQIAKELGLKKSTVGGQKPEILVNRHACSAISSENLRGASLDCMIIDEAARTPDHLSEPRYENRAELIIKNFVRDLNEIPYGHIRLLQPVVLQAVETLQKNII